MVVREREQLMHAAVLGLCGVKAIPSFDAPDTTPSTKPKMRLKGLGEACQGTMIPTCMQRFKKYGVKDHHDLQAVMCWKCDGVE